MEKSGAWYSYAGERIGQGRENVRNFLKANPAIFIKMDAELREKMKIGASAPAPIPPAPVDGEAKAQEAVRSSKRS